MKLKLYILLVMLLGAHGHASIGPSLCDLVGELESFPVEQNGRVKPLYVHACESLKYLTGKSNPLKTSCVQTYCELSTLAMPTSTFDAGTFKTQITHIEVSKLLGLKGKVSFAKLLGLRERVRTALMRSKKENSYKKALQKLWGKLGFYESITMGQDWMFYHKGQWVNLNSFASLEKTIQESARDYQKKFGVAHLTELRFSKSHLTYWALFLALISLTLLTIFFKRPIFGIGFAFATFLVQVAVIYFRIRISGRAPVTNMYETVLFSGMGALILSLILGHLKNRPMMVIAGLFYDILCLFMMNFAGTMLNSSIGPLVPVLRDNFWLSTHVTCVILSYGALAISWILANTVLLKKYLGKMKKSDEKEYSDMIYSCVKLGAVLLAIGIILGGVWADYSWGRFWGWDPKETWSLIVFCLYIAICHGKYTQWIPPRRFNWVVAGAFMSVMMAWFGVNYILASGLHSYGFSQGGAIFLLSFFTVQSLFLALTYKSTK